MKTKLRCTVDQVMSWCPCNPPYTREHVKKLFGRKRYLTALDILHLKIPVDDQFWAVLRKELLPEKIVHEFACRCAEWALKRERKAGREPDERSWNAIRVKRLWLKGEATDEELAAARDAAWDAARAAARDAARAAAWGAARDAARDAAWAAARAAARDAARDAAWDAARAAARDAARDAAWDAARAAARAAFRKMLIKLLENK